ncbi:MAG: CHASE2 domain-containing protein, partial [Pseudomonadota bacterium]
MRAAQTSIADDFLQRRIGAARLVLALVTLLMAFSALFALRAIEPINIALMDLRFRLIEQAPSDTLVIVEIDPESIRQEERWPWSRDRYARAISELQDAGAGLIALDVDFSSLSDRRGDDAFAAALSQRPGEVVLPVFWQWSSRSTTDGAITRTPPHEKFLNDSVVASVTLITEKNGVVRRGWHGVQDGEDYRASIASVLAGAAPGATDAFYIDFSIEPENIQRLSFQDVLSGSFPDETVRGKNILIGATALELGDEFAAPVYGVLPGVDFHALSYESLIGGRALVRPHPALPMIIGAGLLAWLAFAGRRWRWGRFAAVHALVLATAIGAPLLVQNFVAVSFDSGAIIAAQFISIIYVVGVRLGHYTKQILRQRAATAHYQALTSLVVRDNTDGVIVANENGEVELCNDRARALLGVDVSGIDGVHIGDIAPDFPLLDIADVCDAPYTENAPRIVSRQSEYTVPGAGGVILEVVASFSSEHAVDADGESTDQVQVFVYTLRDISARKRIEAAEKEAKDAAIAANE